MPNSGIPAHAVGHLPPQAIQGLDHTPVAVQTPNLIFDNSGQSDVLTGTAGHVDYFVFDASQYGDQTPRQGDYIVGFEGGVDKVVFENTDPSASLEIHNSITGSYGDPTKGDSVVFFRDGDGIVQDLVFVDVSGLSNADFLLYRNDPFGV
jgi:hypothetical protein